MGRIGKLLSFVRVIRNNAKLSDVKVDVGGGDILTASHAQGSGIDSVPLPDDYAVTLRIPRSGGVVTVGFVETDAQQKSGAGEFRIYARNASRAEVVEFCLKADGTALTSNSNGQFELRPDGSQRGQNSNGNYELQANGTVDINGATIDTDGNINAKSLTADTVTADDIIGDSVKASGKELAGHGHIGSPTAATGPISNTGPNI